MTATALRPSGRADLRPAVVVLAAAAAAWALTADRMAGMDAGPGTELGGFGWFAISWLLMMAAMMLPAVVPTVVAYGRRAGHGREAALFVAGYLATWLVVGLVAYGAIEAVRSLDLGFLAWDDAGRYVAAAVIAAAGLYQLTPSKEACLRRLAALRGHRRGGLRLGVEYGGACVGCSWALMASLFALGVMSLTWMAVVAALIAAERLLPRPAPRVVALVLVVLGLAVALVPGDVPGFTVPDSMPAAMPMG